MGSAANAQSCGYVGLRHIQSYWIEGGLGLVVIPTQAFDNPSACTRSDKLFVLATHPQYKSILSTVMLAVSNNTPIQAYGCECHTYWAGQSWPSVGAFGFGGSP